MPIWLSILIILLAFYVMTVLIENRFIQSLDNIASYLKLPESVAGATLLAFGTSAPEISTALVALFLSDASPATGIGAIVGSAIFQILVVIGFTAYVKDTTLDWKPVVRDTLFYAVCVGILIFCLQDGQLTVQEGWLLVGAYLIYLLLLVWWTKNIKEKPREMINEEDLKEAINNQAKPHKVRAIFNLLTYPIDQLINLLPNVQKKRNWTIPVFLLSLLIIGYACYWLVLAAEAFADQVGISEAIIALTVLAGGSSIPEMISSGVVARQGRGDMAIANAIGSNVFDILISLGLPVLIFTSMKGNLILPTAQGSDLSSSVSLLFGSLLLVFLILLFNKFRLNRAIGIFLIIMYVIYVWAAYTGYIDKFMAAL